jgi:Iron-sulfur cluster binding domain of dihydroorotate dehydrogenase B
MGLYKGRVREIRLDVNGQLELSIVCPAGAVPCAGRYLMAIDQDDELAILRIPLFTVESTPHGFWAAPLQPVNWSPGTNLELEGPLGHGFDLPTTVRRLGLVAMGETVSRLMPLVQSAVKIRASITLFTDLKLPRLPAAVEVHPVNSVKDDLDWPDFLALDVPLERLDELRFVLSVPDGAIMPCPAQVLFTTPMPCAGKAQCGVCAIHGRRGWKIACQDGPVFELESLSW